MSIEVHIDPTGAPAKATYPYIGRWTSNGITILFTHKNAGVCLEYAGSKNWIGKFSDTWQEDQYEPVDYKVTIQNER